MNWFALTLIGIWWAAAAGAWRTRDWLPFLAALIATAMLGSGYAILHAN